MKTFKHIVFLIISLIVVSCNEVIEYSPYGSNTNKSDLNKFYTEDLNSLDLQEGDTLTFALFSDSHYFYDELASAVKSINNHKNITFVAIDGDITHLGLAKEYEFFWKQVRKLHYPFVTIIGNHDHLSNGKKIFETLFGPTNYTFTLGNYKFITFNSVIWENGNKSPDFEWLNKEVSESDQNCIVFTHIPPWGDQFTKEYMEKYYSIMETPKVIANIHGHLHNYKDTTIYNKRYFVAEAVYEHEYYIIHLIGNKMEVERIRF